MTVLKKFVTLFLCVFVILPILEARFHGYRQYYNNLINVVKYPVTKEISEQADYNRNGMEEGIKYSEGNSNYVDFRFSNNDGLQARNDYSNSIEKISVPKGCRDQFTCKSDRYPQEYVDQILREHQYLLAYAFEDGVNIDSRIDAPKIRNYCSIKEDYHAPEQAQNIYGEWNWIIQSDNQKFQQRLYYEKCIYKNRNCVDILNNHLIGGYDSKCVQRYVRRKLLALNGTNPELINFNLPVMCCCDTTLT